jgi:hypothetical protein
VPVLIVALLAVLAFAGGVSSWVVFTLAICLGLYLLFGGRRRYRNRMRVGRKRARRWAQEQWLASMQQDAAPPPPAPPPAAIAPPPVPVVDLKVDRLPAEVQKQVERIRRKSDVLGRRADRFPIGSKDLYVVQHTGSDYLPATVKAYLDVPAWSAETPTADGRTPLEIMRNQLDIMESKLDEIADGVRKQRVDDLLANERFLEDTIGRDRDQTELTLPR